MKQIDLSLSRKNSKYSILIGKGLLDQPISILNNLQVSQVAIITNELVAHHYLESLILNLKKSDRTIGIVTILIGDGESYKSQASFNHVMDKLIEKQFKRNDLIIALGGGVIGDLTGFSAACYQRGIDFIQIPTTLLAMVDSSVGGKTAINHPKGKNLIGSFHQPLEVRIDTDCLTSLASREFHAGMAEVIKVAAIQDKQFFQWIECNRKSIIELDDDTLQEMIYSSCQLKSNIVAEDEREQGVRAILNFGHTFGHAIETIKNYNNILHGEAVAIGMVLAAKFSQQYHGLNVEFVTRLESIIRYFKLPTLLPKNISSKQMIGAMALDKKNHNSKLRLILPLKLGQAAIIEHTQEEVESFLRQYETV